jgi:hypothetical protein
MGTELPLLVAAWGPADWYAVVVITGAAVISFVTLAAAYMDALDDLRDLFRSPLPPSDPANLKPYRRP